jgi:hypothetical protein
LPTISASACLSIAAAATMGVTFIIALLVFL